MILTRTLTRTWGILIALSLASTGLAALVSRGQAGQAALAIILLLAGIKAHLILKTYLGLGRIPRVLRGFDIVLAMTMIGMLALALAG
ncbi:hypothetical protein MASR2M74_26570 [Paracoccaceae bacterium]